VLVALSGWGQDEDRRRSEEAGFDAHLVKPLDQIALHKLLVDLSARKQEVESKNTLRDSTLENDHARAN
jgi:hypothetical protein